MLDEGAKGWLALIEAKKLEVAQLTIDIKEEAKRNDRLKSAKMKQASNALLESWAAQQSAGNTFIETETLAFYKEVFGISLYQPVAVKYHTGALSKALFATQLIVRQLSNGLGVFTVTGDSLTKDMHEGLPACDFLMAQEANEDWLVALA